MPLQIITIYCLCADFRVAYGYQDDPQARSTTAEVLTLALVAAAFFHGNVVDTLPVPVCDNMG